MCPIIQDAKDDLRSLFKSYQKCHDPLQLIDQLNASDLESLIADIESFVELEKIGSTKNLAYWNILHEVCLHRLKSLKKSVTSSNSLHNAVNNDIQKIFDKKSIADLDKLKEDVIKTLNSDGKILDKEYWGNMLIEINSEVSRQKFNNIHEKMINKEQSIIDELKSILIINEESISSKDSKSIHLSPGKEKLKGDEYLEDSEEKMTDEYQLPNKSYSWQDKYRPRKPRYFNRVFFSLIYSPLLCYFTKNLLNIFRLKQALIGTNTIRLIMIMIILRQNLYMDINSIYFIPI